MDMDNIPSSLLYSPRISSPRQQIYPNTHDVQRPSSRQSSQAFNTSLLPTSPRPHIQRFTQINHESLEIPFIFTSFVLLQKDSPKDQNAHDITQVAAPSAGVGNSGIGIGVLISWPACMRPYFYASLLSHFYGYGWSGMGWARVIEEIKKIFAALVNKSEKE
jgi:hypothetical protein